ncbi:MAG TPA: TlpA disulfide reductase family protein [Cytophagaceae bacterium]|nr:TlpA disulfide reductase family protein [Cytophagaceae bacterium]
MACSSEKRSEETQETSRLVLKLSGATGAKLVIQELKDKSWLTVDSILDYKGDATFEIHNSEADYYRVMDTTSNMAIVILIPGKTATIEGDLKNVLETFKSSDSKENNQYYNFQRNLFAIRSHEEEWVKKYRTFMESPKTEDSATHYVTLLRDMQDESDAFVKSYIDSIMPSFTVYSLVNYLRIEKEFDYMFTLAERIRKEMPDSKYSRLFIGEISRMKAYKEEETKKDKAAIGTPAPNFTLNDRNGKSISLTSLKGKYVVIDFWASWCGPCRAESPNMVKLYKKMKSDRFEILGVSLDGSEDAWDKAIEKDGLNWLHVSDLMQWNSPVVALYGIEGIPATVVVDPNGIIVAKNLRGEELMTKLEELLK